MDSYFQLGFHMELRKIAQAASMQPKVPAVPSLNNANQSAVSPGMPKPPSVPKIPQMPSQMQGTSAGSTFTDMSAASTSGTKPPGAS